MSKKTGGICAQKKGAKDPPQKQPNQEQPSIDSDGDTMIDESLYSSEPENIVPSNPQLQLGATLDTSSERSECLRKHFRPEDAERVYTVVQHAYNKIKECIVEFGIVRDSEDDMEWQPELERPVYLVRMTEEESCYAAGKVQRPWE